MVNLLKCAKLLTPKLFKGMLKGAGSKTTKLALKQNKKFLSIKSDTQIGKELSTAAKQRLKVPQFSPSDNFNGELFVQIDPKKNTPMALGDFDYKILDFSG
jgi:hypothetical protein